MCAALVVPFGLPCVLRRRAEVCAVLDVLFGLSCIYRAGRAFWAIVCAVLVVLFGLLYVLFFTQHSVTVAKEVFIDRFLRSD